MVGLHSCYTTFSREFFLVVDKCVALQDVDYSCPEWCRLDDYLGPEGRLLLLVHSTASVGYNYQGATQNMRAMVALSILCKPTRGDITLNPYSFFQGPHLFAVRVNR